MRVGIMGGTFDPVHNGHISLAETALRELRLDCVMLLPAGDPPHKAHPIAKADRWSMTRLAADRPHLFACSMEILREGTTYTVDTMRRLCAMNPETKWYYLIGADTLDVLGTWRDLTAVAKMCVFVVAGRAEEAPCPEEMRRLSEEHGCIFERLCFSGPDISSTEIRQRVACGAPIGELVPAAVADYIRERGLYLAAYSVEQLREMLRGELKPSRYTHTLGVAETARRLAAGCGVDPQRAYLAGLLHDCAKYMGTEEMRTLLRERDFDTDPEELAAESVLHAPAGSLLSAERYGVRDASILSAIRKHTIGDGQMSSMDALIYTADFIEPNRRDFQGLSEARTLAERDIFAGMCRCARLTEEYVTSMGAQVHPKTLQMLRNYETIDRQEETL